MKKKTKVTEVITGDEAFNVMQLYAESATELKRLEAKVEKETSAIREKYEDEIAKHQTNLNEANEKLVRYGEFNKDEIFADKKTIDLIYGTVSLRLGTHKVDKKKSLTWESIVLMMKKVNKNFLRTKIEVNKEAIIEAREDKKMMAKLANIGVSVVQEEAITVQSKEEELIDA